MRYPKIYKFLSNKIEERQQRFKSKTLIEIEKELVKSPRDLSFHNDTQAIEATVNTMISPINVMN